jgi:hypothetical protein
MNGNLGFGVFRVLTLGPRPPAVGQAGPYGACIPSPHLYEVSHPYEDSHPNEVLGFLI